MTNLFEPLIKEKFLNKYFVGFHKHRVYEPGRVLINEIFNKMGDQDGNFIENFQSNGFWARLLELFLFEFLNEHSLKIITKYDRPDFHINKNGYEFFIEATTSNISDRELDFTDDKTLAALWANDELFKDESLRQYTMKVGSALFSKLNKEYWNLEWVKNRPLLIAISANHHALASFLPDYKLFEYLYGIRVSSSIDGNGKISWKNSPLIKHNLGEKEIPSGFFNQPNSEYISGVIFINTSDFWKFNRIGFEKGYANQDIKMMRSGYYFNPKENPFPDPFTYTVGRNPRNETWSEGVKIFHNPKAMHPLDVKIFEGVAQNWTNENLEIHGAPMPEFYPFTSRTFIWDYKFIKEKFPKFNESELEAAQALLSMKVFT